MVFSAPEMTTVSKPKRNPASADVSDQKKTRAFIEGRNLMSASHDKRIVDATQMLGVRPGVRATSCELKLPRLTVYKDIGRELPKQLEEMRSQMVTMPESNCGVGGGATAPYLGFNFANASFTRGAKGESGASFKYSSYSLAISSSWPFPVSACATIKCEIANCLWSGSEGTLRALARARALSPFCSSVLASTMRICALFGWLATDRSRYGSASLVLYVLLIELTQIEIGL